ncbi:phage major capsid protein [Cytobacillus praedii]|uniref:phage major capsid protein n=1 Tax=Cytobacillus praedii TaxID=1742358 RepID=UPI002E1C9A67|nr:phage major capsid protein [Cytobacillus praedii]MED3552531.1 phage major capsid protein [Cytobacillus praedii]
MKIELRNIDVQLTGSQETDELFVSGYVNKTGEFSQPLGREKRFVEKIEPGTFNRAIEKGNDIHFLAEHDNAKLLASTKNGSLTLREDEQGLYMKAKISPTSYGKDYHQLISDGLLTNMSFGMQVPAGGDKWSKRSDGMYERTIEEIYLAEVSVVRNPAYVQSSIQARSLDVTSADELFLMSKNNEKEGIITMTNEKTLKELRAQLEALEAQENTNEVVAIENRAIENEVNETRGVELFLKGDMHSEEVRALTTGSQSITVPTVLSNTIVEKLVEQAALFGRSKSFQPTSGTLEVLREDKIGGATFIGEQENAAVDNELTFDKVVLEQRRAATAIELTQQLINDSGINIVDYAVGVMTKRLAREMDKSVLKGDKANKQFEGILTSTVAETVSTIDFATVADADLLDALLDVTLAVHPDHLDGAVFVVNRPTFNRIAKIKDADGRYQLVKDVVNGKPAYKILGHEILIQDHMTGAVAGEVAVAFVNFGVAYATMVKKGASMKRINADTKNALAGTELLLLDVYADGKILNETAIKFIKQSV